MKRIFNRVIILTLCLSMMIGNISYASAAVQRTSDIERAINVLLQSGWTREEIDDLLTEEALLEYKDAQPAVAFEQKYFRVTDEGAYEITEDECELQLQQVAAMESGIAPCLSGYKRDELTTTDGYLTYFVAANTTDKKDEYTISARFEWLKNPWNRKEDVFALGHAQELTQLDRSVYYIYKADITTTIGITRSTYTQEYPTPTSIYVRDGGTVVTIKLEGDAATTNGGPSVTASNHRGYMHYRVKLNRPSAPITSIYAEYLHQESIFSVSPSISFPAGASVSVAPSTKFKRMSPNPYLSFIP